MIGRFQHLLFSGRSVVVVPRGTSSALVVFPTHASMESRHLTEFFLANAVLEARRWVRSGKLNEVRFRHAAASPASEYERIFAAPLRFQQTEDSLLIESSILDQNLVGWNPGVTEAVKPLLESLTEIGDGLPFRERVEMVIWSSLLSCAGLSPDVIAERLALTPRTLQRKLSADGMSYDDVAEKVQREVASRLLTLPELSREEIASCCGFSSVDELESAWKRWGGTSSLRDTGDDDPRH
jgi:AraC-like DNA-binding protein